MSQSQLPEFTDQARSRLAICLMLIRIGIAVVFLMWTIDKFVNPGHAAKVFEKFYKIPSLSATLSYAVGGAQLILVLAFLAGLLRTLTYGLILVMHTVSTFSSWQQYLDPWTYPHLLFFAAIPMLAACVALWMMREFDTYSVDACWKAKPSGQTQVNAAT